MKRKEKRISEVRKEVGLQMQDRRNFLNAMLNVKNTAESIKLQEDFINNLKVQLDTGQITEKNKFGNLLSKEHIMREITSAGFNFEQMKIHLDYCKEDLYYKLYGKEGLIEKAGSIEKLRDSVMGHYLFVRDEIDRIIKKLGEESAV